MTLKECYEQCGGNYEETLQRLHSEQLIARFVVKFLDDSSYSQLLDSLATREAENSFRAAHTLKGVALNLGLTGLYTPAEALTEALRHGWDENAPSMLPAVTEAYEKTTAAIRAWQEGSQS